MTLVAETHVPHAAIDEAAAFFSADELTRLVYAIIEINAWNRLSVTLGSPTPGTYDPGSH